MTETYEVTVLLLGSGGNAPARILVDADSYASARIIALERANHDGRWRDVQVQSCILYPPARRTRRTSALTDD